MTRRLGHALLTALVAVSLLAACADDAQPDAAPSSTPPPSSTTVASTATDEATPAPAAPTLPPEAQAQTAEGAAAYARHYFELVSFAYSSGDTTTLKEVSSPECGNCQQLIATVDGHFESGGSYEGGAITVLSAEAQAPDDTGLSLVTIVYDQEPLRAVAADGSVLASGNGADDQAVEFYVELVDGDWQVFGYAVEQS